MLKENIFSEITSDNQAYWLGFLAADGSINGYQLQIGLSTKDIEHLYRFKDFTGTPNSIYTKMNHCTNNGKYYSASYINFKSEKVVDDLAQYGIIKDKSHQNIDFLSYIPVKYKKPFILGYFDGDGWFTNTKRSSDFGFCGNFELINSISKYLTEIFNWEKPLTITQETHSKITFRIDTQNKYKIKDFLNFYLSYENKCDLLERKLNIAKILQEKIQIKEKKIIPPKSKEEQSLKYTLQCPICRNTFIGFKSQIHCSQECAHIAQRRSERPSREEFKKLIRKESFLSLGRKFNVSDKAISKWCIAYNLPSKKSEIKKYSDEEWEKI